MKKKWINIFLAVVISGSLTLPRSVIEAGGIPGINELFLDRFLGAQFIGEWLSYMTAPLVAFYFGGIIFSTKRVIKKFSYIMAWVFLVATSIYVLFTYKIPGEIEQVLTEKVIINSCVKKQMEGMNFKSEEEMATHKHSVTEECGLLQKKFSAIYFPCLREGETDAECQNKAIEALKGMKL